MPTWLPNVLTLAGVAITGLLTLWGSAVVTRRTAKAEDRKADAAVQASINAGFEALNAGWKMHTDEMRVDLLETKGELIKARGEIADLRGYIREFFQHIDSLEQMLRNNGLAVPERRYPPAFALINGGKTRSRRRNGNE